MRVSKTKGGTAGKQTKSSSSAVAHLLLSGSTLSHVVTQYPGYSLQNLLKMKVFSSFCSVMKENASKATWPKNLKYRGGCSVTASLVEWCVSNIQCKRSFKQKQLYIYGAKNTRKSSFLYILMRYCTSFEIPQGEDFYDLFGDPEPELCYIDEYKGAKPIHWWNLFLQGGPPMNLRIKGSQTQKKSNPPVIMISNYSLETVYRKALLENPEALDPLLTRLEVIQIPSGVVLDTEGFEESLATATAATISQMIAQLPPPVVITDSDLCDRIAALSTSQSSQATELYINSDCSSPLLSRRRDKRPASQELEVSNDSTNLSPTSESSSSSIVSTVNRSSLGLATSSGAPPVSEISHHSVNTFKKFRRVYDDFE